MNAIVLIIIILVVMFGAFRILVDLQKNDLTLTINELAELNINRIKNLFKRKK